MRLPWLSVSLLAASSVAQAQASLLGYVRDDESLRGIPGVEVSVEGSDKRARTDKEGKYALKDLAAGIARIHVRFLGFAPIDTTLELSGGKPTESVFFLSKHVAVLDTITTQSGRVASAGFESFELRRSKGFGRFIDSIELKRSENRQLSELIRERGAVSVVTPSTCHGDHLLWCSWRVASSRRGGADGFCLARVILDGQVVAAGNVIPDRDAPPFSPQRVLDAYERDKERAWGRAFDLNSLGVSGLIGVEVYRSAADTQGIFAGDDAGCGTVVLWSRRGVR